MSDRIPISWSGSALDPSGYGEATRGYLQSLVASGRLHLKLIPKYFWNGEMPDLGPSMRGMIKKLQGNDFDMTKPYLFIQHLTPDQYRLGAGSCKYHIGVTTFETDGIPPTWQMNTRGMDEIWTFSKWGAQVFRDMGIRRPITVIPHGVDIVRFRNGLEPLEIASKFNDHFVIGSVFEWTERKNPRGLLTSYWGAFKPTDQVLLLLKVFYQYPYEQSRRYVLSYIEELKRELRLTKTPPIMLLNGILPSSDLPRFYNTCNAYFLPSRGEGWGLSYSESMACARPTIAVNWSGHTEFMNHENSFLIDDFKMRPVLDSECMNQPHYRGMSWADPNPLAMAHTLRKVYDNPELAHEKGVLARSHMAANYTWGKVAARAVERIDQIWQDVGTK